MCWNASISLNTFLLGMFAIGLGVMNNVVPVTKAIFYMSFVSMQLIEYFIWTNLDNPMRNALWSKVGLGLIFIQPMAALLTFGITSPMTWMAIMAYVVFVGIVNVIIKPLQTVDFSSVRAENGHLRWNWLQYPLWVMAIWLFAMFIDNVIKREWLELGISLFIVFAVFFTYLKSNTWGSLWCWVANFISIVILWRVFKRDVCLYISHEPGSVKK
jgi:hypothetical protein